MCEIKEKHPSTGCIPVYKRSAAHIFNYLNKIFTNEKEGIDLGLDISSPRFNRTKEEMLKQVHHFVVNDYHYEVKYAVIDDIIWRWVLDYKKNTIDHFWSENALINSQKLLEDFVVPRHCFRNLLVDLSAKYLTEQQISNLFKSHLKICIITEAESRLLKSLNLSEKMPDCYNDPTHVDFQNPWVRYKRAGINPCKLSFKKEYFN